MFAQINHMAIISPHYPALEKFYQAVFGLRPSKRSRHGSAATTGDGYVGLNLIPRRDGYVGGIDHFGMVVDDVAPVLERMQRKHKRANIVKRPSARPFAAYSGHDPDGNVFDLAQKRDDTRKEVYADIAAEGWAQDRYFNKFAIRTPNAEQCAEFYADVFELQPVNRNNAALGYHLTDGRVTLSILPWSIPTFEGMSIKRPGPDHLGFRVENLVAFKAHVAETAGANPYLAPVPLGGSPESDVRRRFFEKQAGGKWQMSDPDGNWIDITDE
ncbi:MAG TPA: VOC family protein [Micropepsaceae bacterium]|jgi:catechol 2,3-dioxygenase-like lactoylglutathione lyase family enzyme|nr:VOC family protein [Micropepsaceae bacterium]